MKWIQPITLEAFLNIPQKEAGFFDSFVYEPTNSEELAHGYLFILGEIRTASPNFTYFLNFLASILRREYYGTNGKNPEENLSTVLARINENPERLFANQLPSLFGNIHILVGALVRNNLVLGFTGDMHALLLKQKEITDLTALASPGSATDAKQKLFTHLVTGEVDEGDRLLFATQNIFENLHHIGLIRQLSLNPFPQEQEFQKFLRQHRFNIKTKGVLHYILLSQAASRKDKVRRLDHYTPSLSSFSSGPAIFRIGANIAKPILYLGVKIPFTLMKATIKTSFRNRNRIPLRKEEIKHKKEKLQNIQTPAQQEETMIENRSNETAPLPAQSEPPPLYSQAILGSNAILQKRPKRLFLHAKVFILILALSIASLFAGFLFIPQRQFETPPKTSFFNKDPLLLKLTIVPAPAIILEDPLLHTADTFVSYKKAFYFWDQEKNIVARFQIPTFIQNSVPTNGNLQEAHLAAIVEPGIAIFTKQGLLAFDLATGNVEALGQSFFKQQSSPDSEMPRVKLFASWHDALYVLEPIDGEIYKFSINVYGLDGEKKWILPSSKKLPVGATDFAIDGTLYALLQDGSVDMYLKGEFLKTIQGMIEPRIENADKIFTSADQSYLWILERKHSRVVILTKNGVFTKQLHFPALKEIKDIYITSDNTLYLLESDKLYSYKVEIGNY